MSITSHKEYYLQKYQNEGVPFLINRKLLIHKQLERPPRTYVVYSDLHGSYEKYLYWLKNGLGYYRIVISEILGSSYAPEIYKKYEKLFLLVNRTRINDIETHIKEGGDGLSYDPQNFFSAPVPKRFIAVLEKIEKCGLSKERILEDLLKVLRLITRGDEHRIIKVIPPLFLENIIKLYFKKDRASYESLVKGIVTNSNIYPIVLSILVKISLINMFDKHINLGDTFDRGNNSDKLITLYKAFFGPANDSSPLHYIWGNHDILWLGASIGNPVLAVTALRISLRYNNVDFLARYGFKLDKLEEFATKCYQNLPTGKYLKGKNFKKWSQELTCKMTKVLLILEAKLTVTTLRDAMEITGEIDYRPSLEYYEALLKHIPADIADDKKAWEKFIKDNPLYSDVYFPTINKEAPEVLTKEEQEIVDDLVTQFTTLPKLQADIKWLSRKGETYRVVDNTLYYHAALPATEEMDLAEIKGMKGKVLLDFIQRDLKRIFQTHRDGEEITIREKVYLWFLWCGPISPFFCKSKMATLERAIFDKENAASNDVTTWTETPNPYYANIRNDIFLNNILTTFHADKICMGHTPVKTLQQGILSQNLSAFIIDGGASEAYGDRGLVLINTPDYTYLTQHPSLEDLKKAEEEECLPDIKISTLEEKKNLKLRHTDKGYFLRRELEAIDQLLNDKIDKFNDKYFYP